jgi:TRAP-type C4-dicarboxylate transport system permease small subunit
MSESARAPGAAERWFVALNRFAVVLLMALMVALVFANVVTRYVFNYSIIWAEELSQYLMVWIAYIGAGLALREGRHVSVDIGQDLLPPAGRTALRFVVALLVLAFMATLTVLGVQFAQFAWDLETPVMQAPLGLAYAAVPVGAAIFCVHFLFFFRDFVLKRYHEPENLEPAEEVSLAPEEAGV